MEQTQNTQNTQHTEYKKCSRCRKTQIMHHFGFKKNGDEFKTCFRCRKNQDITNEPIISEVEDVQIKDNKEDEETPKGEDIYSIMEKICEDANVKIIVKECVKTIQRYGYRQVDFDYSLFTKLKHATETNTENAASFIEFFESKRVVSLFVSPYGVGLLICPDANNLFLLNLSSIEVIDRYIISVSLKNKKRCQLCYEKNSKKFKECGQCSKQCCTKCFRKSKCLSCPFCRYTLLNHMEKYIEKLSIEDQTKLIKQHVCINNIEI